MINDLYAERAMMSFRDPCSAVKHMRDHNRVIALAQRGLLGRLQPSSVV